MVDWSAHPVNSDFPYQRTSAERRVEVACPKTTHTVLTGQGTRCSCSLRSSVGILFGAPSGSSSYSSACGLFDQKSDTLHKPECDEREYGSSTGPPSSHAGGLTGLTGQDDQQASDKQWMWMKRGMATSRLYMKPDEMCLGLKSCVGVDLLELVRGILDYKREPSSVRSGSGGWKSSQSETEKVSGFVRLRSA